MTTEPDHTDDLKPEHYHEILSAAGKIVAIELHRLIQSNLTIGVEEGIKRFNELYPLCAIEPERIEALLRREICRYLIDLDQHAYDGWDDRLFHLANEGSALDDPS